MRVSGTQQLECNNLATLRHFTPTCKCFKLVEDNDIQTQQFHNHFSSRHHKKHPCRIYVKMARTHTHAEIAHFPTRCIIRAKEARSRRPSAFQVLMMHRIGKCAISAWAWVLTFILWPVRNIKAAMWKSHISTHSFSAWIVSWTWDKTLFSRLTVETIWYLIFSTWSWLKFYDNYSWTSQHLGWRFSHTMRVVVWLHHHCAWYHAITSLVPWQW